MDTPVSDDTDGDTLADLQADPDAAQGFQDAEDRLFLEQLHEALEKALDELPTRQGDTLRCRFYQAQSLEEIATAEGVSKEAVRLWQAKGLQALRQKAKLRQFVEERTPYYLHVGHREFQRTRESAVERIVIRRERLMEPRAERPRLDRDRLEAQAVNVSAVYINAIEEPFIRIFFRLRFLRGMSWKGVAAVAGGGKTGAAVRDACLRYLSAHPEPPGG